MKQLTCLLFCFLYLWSCQIFDIVQQSVFTQLPILFRKEEVSLSIAESILVTLVFLLEYFAFSLKSEFEILLEQSKLPASTKHISLCSYFCLFEQIFVTWLLKHYFSLTNLTNKPNSVQCSHFIPRDTIRKPLVFQFFSGVIKSEY